MKTPSAANAMWTECVPSDPFQSEVMTGSTVCDKVRVLLVRLAR